MCDVNEPQCALINNKNSPWNMSIVGGNRQDNTLLGGSDLLDLCTETEDPVSAIDNSSNIIIDSIERPYSTSKSTIKPLGTVTANGCAHLSTLNSLALLETGVSDQEIGKKIVASNGVSQSRPVTKLNDESRSIVDSNSSSIYPVVTNDNDIDQKTPVANGFHQIRPKPTTKQDSASKTQINKISEFKDATVPCIKDLEKVALVAEDVYQSIPLSGTYAAKNIDVESKVSTNSDPTSLETVVNNETDDDDDDDDHTNQISTTLIANDGVKPARSNTYLKVKEVVTGDENGEWGDVDTESVTGCSETSVDLTLKTAVTVCNCIMIVLAVGLIAGIGVLFVGILDEFQASRAEASPIMSVLTGILFGGGGIVGPLMNRFNGGYLCMIGGVLAFLGCLISFFSPSVPVLIIGVGVISGLGLTAPFLIAFVTTGEIFSTRRVTMLTIVGLCYGISGVIFPYVTSKLMDIFGWRGVFLIYGGALLNCVPIGYLNAIVKRQLKTAKKTKIEDVLNISLFRKPMFLVLAFSILISTIFLPTVNFFFVDMIREKGLDVDTGSTLLSINGFSNVVGRLIVITLSVALKVDLVVQYTLYLAIASITATGFVFAVTYTELLVPSIIFGLFWGMTGLSYPSMLLELSGPKRYASAFGYCNFLGGIAELCGGPLAGMIKDETGSYDVVYYITTGMGLLASSIIACMFIIKHCQKQNSSHTTTETEVRDKVRGRVKDNLSRTIHIHSNSSLNIHSI
ncbi:monocarboxylate transporter 6 [Patella vulgata]|uniref:monocarboxylate transporter 6 n=1 Tax=Patella vulgata TaxID=6465 RepID=UPI0021804753|nr:monocarboxylate transporter 6 [Patella vulgata]XP_050401443.1 monocarboxylate transporter 6 [Patella vulgata]XP_050401444.1 monocarboxylate transporter 6 [Patella vulgata]